MNKSVEANCSNVRAPMFACSSIVLCIAYYISHERRPARLKGICLLFSNEEKQFLIQSMAYLIVSKNQYFCEYRLPFSRDIREGTRLANLWDVTGGVRKLLISIFRSCDI